eukprot:872207-Rhodomonas_salina.2
MEAGRNRRRLQGSRRREGFAEADDAVEARRLLIEVRGPIDSIVPLHRILVNSRERLHFERNATPRTMYQAHG